MWNFVFMLRVNCEVRNMVIKYEGEGIGIEVWAMSE